MSHASVRNLGVVENAGPNHLKGFMHDAISKASDVDIGVAFITESGLTHLISALKKAAGRGRVRILTGLYQCFTEPKALRTLLRVQSQAAEQFELRISTDEHFHWKAYFFFSPSLVRVSIGSSNLTHDGLKSSGEMNLTLSVKRDSAPLRAIHRVFEAEWERGRPLTKAIIERYEKARPSQAGRLLRAAIPLAKILGSRKPLPTERSTLEPRFWRAGITGFADDDTERAVEEETDWDEKGYLWFSTGGRKYQEKDRVVLFDLARGHVELIEVVRTTILTRLTPCGRKFAAYVRVRHSHSRRLGQAFWKRMRQHGRIMKKSDAEDDRKLTATRFSQLVDGLRLL